MAQDPSVGRIVHFVLPEGSNYEGEHRAAIITQVWQPLSHESAPGMSNLQVFKGQSTDFNRFRDGSPVSCGAALGTDGATVMLGSILYSEEPKPGTWHWPEHVPARS
jgi:hypothetical protein